MVARIELDNLVKALNILVQQAQPEVLALLDTVSGLPVPAARRILFEGLTAVFEKHSKTASAVGGNWYTTLREKYGDGSSFTIHDDAVQESAYIQKGLRRLLYSERFEQDPRNIGGELSTKTDLWVKRSARNTVYHTARNDKAAVRFARVPSGSETCAFCLMLASRGFVYTSAKSAGQFNRYHHDCDCVITPMFVGNKVPKIAGYEPDALYREYLAARRVAVRQMADAGLKTSPSMDRLTTALKDLREAKKLSDDAYNRSSNEWHKDEVLWKVRQYALETNTHGEQLHPWEVRFVERMEARGEKLEWIPRDPDGKPTNDFKWISKGNMLADVKSTKAKYSSIKKRITYAVVNSEKADPPVVKDSFVIDIGKRNLGDKLLHQLNEYNAKSAKGMIERLYVMYRDGEQLKEIDLL